MKKLLLFLMVAFLVMFLSACSKDKSPTGADEVKQVTLQYFVSGAPENTPVDVIYDSGASGGGEVLLHTTLPFASGACDLTGCHQARCYAASASNSLKVEIYRNGSPWVSNDQPSTIMGYLVIDVYVAP